jgi:hypothetical protein
LPDDGARSSCRVAEAALELAVAVRIATTTPVFGAQIEEELRARVGFSIGVCSLAL